MQAFKSVGKLPAKNLTLKKFDFPRATSSVKKNLTAGQNVVLNGWVDRKPKKMGKGLIFGRLRDTHGSIAQLVDRNDPPLLKSLQPESAISVSGVVEPNGTNSSYDVVVDHVQVLNESNIIGSQLTTGSTKEWPAEHRYLQLRNSSSLQRNLKKRAAVVRSCRTTLDNLDFTEIETPLLFKSTPEGAREFLVPTRKKGMMYALPQSPQQYKQLLMASGVHRYYQIAKCFRDEDLRQDRQYEFTQLDMEMSFANGTEVRSVIEEVVRNVWSATGKNLIKPNGEPHSTNPQEKSAFSYLTYKDAIAKYGIDKPDLRSTIEIIDISEYAKSINDLFPVVEAIVLDGDSPLLHDVAQYKRMPVILKDLYAFENTGEGSTEAVQKAVSTVAHLHDYGGLKQKLDLKPGQVVAIGNRQKVSYENPTPLGRFRQLAIEAFPEDRRLLKPDGTPMVADQDFVATWVVDFPLFNALETKAAGEGGDEYPAYDTSSFVTTHHPFTMVHQDDYDLLASDPLKARGQHYDLVVNGVEVGGGSTRIHDVQLQQYIFDHILRIPNSQKLFGHLLRAFATGCPPHAGLAIGLDRMTAMLCGTSSIRDVIAFPKTITGADPMIGCPSKVTSDQMKPYHIKV